MWRLFLSRNIETQRPAREVRFPVVLTMAEKQHARKIVHIFGQNICGFDLLRADSGGCDDAPPRSPVQSPVHPA
jgi:hypothetical protein